MAGDWIKVEKDTPEKPEMYRLADILGQSHADVFLACFRFWRWVDSQTDNGVIVAPPTAIDDVAHIRGFCDALLEVGWLVPGRNSLAIPHFERHMGASAKRRMVDSASRAERRALAKSVSKADKSRTGATEMSDSNRTKSRTREEKSREELIPPLPPVEQQPSERVDGSEPDGPIDQTPAGLAQRWCFLYRGTVSSERDPYKVAPAFGEWLRLGLVTPDALRAEIERKARDRTEPVWAMKDRLIPRQRANGAKQTQSDEETPEQRAERLRKQKELIEREKRERGTKSIKQVMQELALEQAAEREAAAKASCERTATGAV